MHYSKIIYISYQPLTTAFEENFYINDFIGAGQTVEYWDLTAVYHADLKLNYVIDRTYITLFDNQQMLSDKLNENKDAFYIVFITLNHQVDSLFRLLRSANVTTSFFARGMLPFPSIDTPLWIRVKEKIGLATDPRYINTKVRNYLTARAKFKGLVKTHNIVFQAGTEGIYTVGVGASEENLHAQKIQINGLDYDQYLLIKDLPDRLISEPYCVFLDNYLPYHPDLDILGIKKISPNNYYRGLNQFFDKIEKEHQIKVIIAAHPKADYSNNPFNDRLVFIRKTALAVKSAEFVISHASTSAAFAVLFNKQILFVYNDEMESIYKHTMVPVIKSFSRELGGQLLNIDHIDENSLAVTTPSEVKYITYRYKYLTSPQTENRLTKEVLFSFLGINDE